MTLKKKLIGIRFPERANASIAKYERIHAILMISFEYSYCLKNVKKLDEDFVHYMNVALQLTVVHFEAIQPAILSPIS